VSGRPARALAVLLAPALCACAGRPPARTAAPQVVRRASPAVPRPSTAVPPAVPAPGTILDHRTGRPIAFEDLAARLAGASVVYVGESHDQAAHHEFQRRVLEAVADRSAGRPLALGLEMFSRPQQRHLDAFSSGEIDEEGLLERSEWAKRWGFGWEMYRPLLVLARERGIALVALNAPREVTRKVAREGLAGLSEEERAGLPELRLDDAAHRRFVREAFGAHGASMTEDRFERFYTAQVVWDETMADTAARWLERAGPASRMVVVAGNGHVADRFGIPARAHRRVPRPYVTIVQEVAAAPDPESKDAPDPPRLDVGYADFTAWWPPSKPD
jgi:uncharacterized iron-regulated protein